MARMPKMDPVSMAQFEANLRMDGSSFPGQKYAARPAKSNVVTAPLSSLPEFRSAVEPELPGPSKSEAEILFEKLDIDKSGELSLQELSFRLHDEGFSETEISLLFTRLDTNHDGRLSRHEFVTGFGYYRNMKSCGLQRFHVDTAAGLPNVMG